MSTNILDVINQKLASFTSQVRSVEEKVAAERDLRAGQVSSLQDRVHALEVDRDLMTTELQTRMAQHDALVARVDLLVSKLNELGVEGV